MVCACTLALLRTASSFVKDKTHITQSLHVNLIVGKEVPYPHCAVPRCTEYHRSVGVGCNGRYLCVVANKRAVQLPQGGIPHFHCGRKHSAFNLKRDRLVTKHI